MNLVWLEAEMRTAIEAMSDVQRVATVLAGEARSEPIEGIVAVANVIRHRVNAKAWFGKDFSDVATKRLQFSCLTPLGGKANYKRVLAIARKFASHEAITDPQVRQCVLIAHGITGDYLIDNVQGATHYHTATLTPRPAWALAHTPVKQVGHHVFYVGIK